MEAPITRIIISGGLCISGPLIVGNSQVMSLMSQLRTSLKGVDIGGFPYMGDPK